MNDSTEFPPLFNNLPNSWKNFIKPEITINNYACFSALSNFIDNKKELEQVFPPKEEIFAAFDLPPEQVKCVIIGQDPYHGKNQANGLAFSVSKKVSIPPSLSNIFKELSEDLNIPYPKTGDLSSWKNNGVLLLNSVLTVEEKKPGSHKEKGWEIFTNLIIKCLSKYKDNVVFMLWGNFAKEKIIFIDQDKHCVLTSTHPSPHSFFGNANPNVQSFYKSRPFSKANNFLKEMGIQEIDWRLGE